MSNEHEHAGPTITILFRQIFDGPPIAVSAHRDEGEAARALGRLALERRMPAGVYFTECIPLVDVTLSGRIVVDVLEPVDEVQAQPDVDPAGVADLALRQRHADLAGALGLNEPRPWSDMCREVRAHRRVSEDDEVERVKVGKALGMVWDDANGVPTWRALRAQARRARDLGGEAFVTALRSALEPCGPGVVDMTRPELIGQVRRLVNEGLATVSAELRARLVRELDPNWRSNRERLERAGAEYHRFVSRFRGADWDELEQTTRDDRARTAQCIVRAYLTDPEG